MGCLEPRRRHGAAALQMPWLVKAEDAQDAEGGKGGRPGLLYVHVPRCGGTSMSIHYAVDQQSWQGKGALSQMMLRFFFYRYQAITPQHHTRPADSPHEGAAQALARLHRASACVWWAAAARTRHTQPLSLSLSFCCPKGLQAPLPLGCPLCVTAVRERQLPVAHVGDAVGAHVAPHRHRHLRRPARLPPSLRGLGALHAEPGRWDKADASHKARPRILPSAQLRPSQPGYSRGGGGPPLSCV